MYKTFSILILLVGFVTKNFAQTPNWAENIATIFYKNCTSCHHPDGIAPSSFLEYTDVANHSGYSMRFQVESKMMPPWPADPSYRHYAGERVLKDTEINAITTWLSNGSPMGDMSKAPKKPIYSKDSKIGTYDLKIKIPTYMSTAATGDIYRCFSLPSGLTSNKFVSAIEVVPGNPKIVHHVLVFQDTTSTTDNLDKADPLPGYTNFGGTGSQTSILMAPYVPGAEPIYFPGGTGIKMYKNARVILQIHYPQGTATEKDSSYVVIRFSKQTNTREVFIAPVLNQTNVTNGPFILQKDAVKTFYQGITIPLDVTLLSIMPHMHLIGKSTKVFAKPPVGDTIPLVRINDWDFHWQGEYKFQYLQKIAKGTQIQSIVTYDNTINNPNQPSNPTKIVVLGEATTSEMILTYFYYMAYQTGDEKILQDSSLLQASIFKTIADKVEIYPNPASSILNIKMNRAPATFEVIDWLGRVVIFEEDLASVNLNGRDLNLKSIDISGLHNGMYSVLIRTEGKIYSQKFIKN